MLYRWRSSLVDAVRDDPVGGGCARPGWKTPSGSKLAAAIGVTRPIASTGKAEEEADEETQTRKREEGKGIEARKVRCGRMYGMVVPIENVSERTWSMALLLFVRATLGFSCSTLSALTRRRAQATRLGASSPRNTSAPLARKKKRN